MKTKKTILYKAVIDQIYWQVQLQSNRYQPSHIEFNKPVEVEIIIKEKIEDGKDR